ncbi:Aspartate/methionine/tyrosine aminotransferase [Terriglobus roseus]|uniref:Aspartate/methionine/tyrosine aminotransferase n=1 Tax=Terriglobus roseus TaxID=392734 RepID=A0A1G7J093_9BACT|nr:Aspartate/methionine/tyrosine aminotransferase [Terriglobus roseus]
MIVDASPFDSMSAMHFASRTEFGYELSPFGDALQRAKQHSEFIDLTVSNPTRCRFDYSAIPLNTLASEASLHYDANALGMLSARIAVAGLYSGIDAERILLTASTSEAYGFLFKLLCEPGDAILVPSPSYPLFDLLARLHDVELIKYPLVYHDGWQIDPASLEAAVTERTRAIIAIHPNNPTGHYCSGMDRAVLDDVAQRYGLPLIVDEVFLDYSVEDSAPSFAKADAPVLTFVMGGLSKLLALPQMKLAWTVVCGSDQEVTNALQRLEIITDTFLSVATPVQAALPAWLSVRAQIQQQILERVTANLIALDNLIRGTVVSRLRVEGGWCVVLRVPAVMDDVALAISLLDQAHVAVHPGSFYGFPSKGWLVVSLLGNPAQFAEGLQRMLQLL